MVDDPKTFARTFFRNLSDRALSPDSRFYVPLYEGSINDPVGLLAFAIESTPDDSVQLLSGFRGTGKSTELRRLRKRLVEAGYLVVLCDIEDSINLSTPVDISDFLLALAGSFGDALSADDLLGSDPSRESYWARAWSFFTRTRVELAEIEASAGLPDGPELSLKAALKSDPSFKQRLQERMAGHLGALVRDVHLYFEKCVKQLKDRHGATSEVVLLVDSVEHIRGTSINADDVHTSVETLFVSHADKLHIPYVHVVYTVPPYLKVRFNGLSALYEPGGLVLLPALKLMDEKDGGRCAEGFDLMERVVRARGDWESLLGDRKCLDRLIAFSGGHLRDMLRLLASVLRRAGSLPVPEAIVDAAIDEVRNEYLPVSESDAAWLRRVASSHQSGLEDMSRLADLARFLDTHLMLCYRNGHEWYDVHPLIADVIGARPDA